MRWSCEAFDPTTEEGAAALGLASPLPKEGFGEITPDASWTKCDCQRCELMDCQEYHGISRIIRFHRIYFPSYFSGQSLFSFDRSVNYPGCTALRSVSVGGPSLKSLATIV